jgi:hypothetical protein
VVNHLVGHDLALGTQELNLEGGRWSVIQTGGLCFSTILLELQLPEMHRSALDERGGLGAIGLHHPRDQDTTGASDHGH